MATKFHRNFSEEIMRYAQHLCVAFVRSFVYTENYLLLDFERKETKIRVYFKCHMMMMCEQNGNCNEQRHMYATNLFFTLQNSVCRMGVCVRLYIWNNIISEVALRSLQSTLKSISVADMRRHRVWKHFTVVASDE